MNETLYEILLDQGLTEEQIERILALGEIQTTDPSLVRQEEMAERLRETPGARGRGWGRIYRQAQPAEHLGVLAQRMSGMYGQRKAEEARVAAARRQTEARMSLLRALGRRRAGVTSPGGAMGTPPVQGMPPGAAPLETNPWSAPEIVWNR